MRVVSVGVSDLEDSFGYFLLEFNDGFFIVVVGFIVFSLEKVC